MKKFSDFIKRHASAAVVALLFSGSLVAAQGFIQAFQSGTSTTPVAYGINDATSGIAFPTTGALNLIKHVITSGGTLPTVATCGTGAVTAGSTDVAGEVTATGATACTLSFGTAYTAAPFCVAVDETTAAGLKLLPVAATGFTISGLTSGDKFAYACLAKAGG